MCERIFRLVRARSPENHQHAHCGREQHQSSAESVECPVVHSDSDDDALGSCFGEAVLDVAVDDFVVGGVMFVAEGGKFCDGCQ